MSSNFLQFNPTAQNQDTDSQYAADALRTAGITVDATFPSALANKLFFQTTTAIAALMQSLANKGYTVSDADVGALTSQLSVLRTLADGPAPPSGGVTLSTDTTLPGGLPNSCYFCIGSITVTLYAAMSLTNYTVTVINKGTGAITIAAAGSETINGSATYTLAAQYNAVTIVSDGTTGNWFVIASR